MAGGYLAQVQALIAQRMKENPEEMKRKLKEIEEAKKTPKVQPKPLFDPQLTQELILYLNKAVPFNIQVMKDLIKRGADIKAKSEYDFTVLHWASWFGDMELAKECLQAGISVNAQNRYGNTPLHLAVDWDKIKMAKFLIDSGADVNVKNDDGHTPLHWAKSQEMEALLIEHGAE